MILLDLWKMPCRDTESERDFTKLRAVLTPTVILLFTCDNHVNTSPQASAYEYTWKTDEAVSWSQQVGALLMWLVWFFGLLRKIHKLSVETGKSGWSHVEVRAVVGYSINPDGTLKYISWAMQENWWVWNKWGFLAFKPCWFYRVKIITGIMCGGITTVLWMYSGKAFYWRSRWWSCYIFN